MLIGVSRDRSLGDIIIINFLCLGSGVHLYDSLKCMRIMCSTATYHRRPLLQVVSCKREVVVCVF
jgi:hypothetical protein